MARRVTLKDVALRAGVTTATVSYVINDTPGQTINPQTRKRVMEAVASLHYIPNAHARMLRGHTQLCMGVVIRKNLSVPRFSRTVYAIQSRLAERGYSVLLLGQGRLASGYADFIEAYLAHRIAGVIYLGEDNQGPDGQSVRLIRDESIPFVAYDCRRASDAYSSVDLDYEGGARLLTSRVLCSRPSRLLYLRPSIETPQETLREAGVREACAADGPTELIVAHMPITLGNIDVWDTRYSVGSTEEGLRLTEEFRSEVARAARCLGKGDAAITSWAGWSHHVRKVLGGTRVVTGELANNGENLLAASYYTVMPNYQAGLVLANEALALVEGSAPTSRVLALDEVVDTTGEPL